MEHEISNVKPTPYKTRINRQYRGGIPSLQNRGDISMSKGQVNFQKDNEYYTPKEIVAMFGQFDYDPATTKEKAAEFGITEYDTIETDGLKTDWTKHKNIWINPPFSEKHKFIEKAYETYNKNKNINIYVLFPIEFLTTKRFHNVAMGGKIYLPNRRIPFESGLGKHSKSPAFGSVIIKVQDKWELEPLNLDDTKFEQISLF